MPPGPCTRPPFVTGKKYFVYGGAYYRPFVSDGETIYMVVEDPREAAA